MLSDEEKKEYEELKSLLYQGTLTQHGKRKLIGIIEKQSKEIEELKEKNKDLDEQNFKYTIKIASLQTDVQEITKLINKNWEDKIKAKIEESDKMKSNGEYTILFNSDNVMEVVKAILQSLLEKE